LLGMVAGGIGATLLPAMAAPRGDDAPSALALVPFIGTGPGRTIGLAWRPASHREEEFRLLGAEIAAAAKDR